LSRRNLVLWIAVLSSVVVASVASNSLDDGGLFLGMPVSLLHPLVACLLLSFLFWLFSRTEWHRGDS